MMEANEHKEERAMEFQHREYPVFELFNDRWALVTAGTPEDFNTMTIGWGSMGTIWGPPHRGKSVLTVYVSPARYTHSYLEKNEYFTVSFFPEAYRKDLGILGSRSGRDGDKVALTELTPVAVEHGVDYAQAELTFVCKKLYSHQFELERVPRDVADWIYTRVPPHTMYIGEIVEVVDRT